MFRYDYESVFGPYIKGLVKQKKACGFIYDNETYILKKFDEFCIENGHDEVTVTRDMAMKWATQRDTEGTDYRNNRVCVLRQLSLYMISVGINCYIPHRQPSGTIPAPHIPDAGQLGELFEAIDCHLPENSHWHRFSMEYQVLFRLYYCCGLRLSEGCRLKTEDVDLRDGILTIVESKGKKSRLVYMSEDMTALCRAYDDRISATHAGRVWFFPGRKTDRPLGKSAIDAKFKEFWEMTECSKSCDKAPTVHSLRHAFVVHRMNQWMADGVPLDVMMPYLGRHLGHSGLHDTLYYYHQVSSAFRIVREKDRLSDNIIPEVKVYDYE